MNNRICPNCGIKMEHYQEKNTQGLRCPKCGTFGFVTSYFSKEEADTTIYSAYILPQEISTEKIKTLSQIIGKNFLACKQILSTGAMTFCGEASTLHIGENLTFKEKLQILKKSSISFRISPDFPYEI